MDWLSRQIKLLTRSAVAFAIAALFCVAAIAMFSAAAFVWLSQHYDAITAFLTIGLGFLVAGGACAIVAFAALHLRRRYRMERSRHQLMHLEPDLLAAGLDVVRVVGGRKAASVAAGVIAIYWLFYRDGVGRREQRL